MKNLLLFLQLISRRFSLKIVRIIFVIIFYCAFSSTFLQATDLSVEEILQPLSEVDLNGKYPVSFVIKNNLYLDADIFTVTVSISNAQQGISWTLKDTFGLLEKYTSATFSSTIQWVPDIEGEHIIFVRVNYLEDINRSNDTLRKYVMVVKKPIQPMEHPILDLSDILFPKNSTNPELKPMRIVETRLHFKPFTPPSWGFYNLVIKKTPGSSPSWIIRNLIIPKITTDYWVTNWGSVSVDLQSSNTVSYKEIKSLTPIVIEPEWDDSDTFKIPINHHSCDLSTGLKINIPLGLNYTEQIVPQVNQPPTDTVYRSDMPNIDLSSTEHPYWGSGYAGDRNACAPAGCANSMEWLELRNPKIKSNLSHRGKLEELSKYMERQNEQGPYYDSMIIKGKLRYINAHKLPVHVKFWEKGIIGDVESGDDYEQKATNMGDGVKWVSWDFLKHEMQNNEDVEAGLFYYTKTDNSGWVCTGSHNIVISGVAEGAGNKQIWFRDDSLQTRSGGTREVSAQWRVSSDSIPCLNYNITDSVHSKTVVLGVYSESYDSTITFKEKGQIDQIFESDGRFVREQNKSSKRISGFEPRVANVIAKSKKGDVSQWIVKNMPYSIDGVNQFETYFDAKKVGLINVFGKNDNPDILVSNDSIFVKIIYSDSIWQTPKQITEDNFFWYKFNKSSITKLPEGSIDNDNFKITDIYRPYNPTFTGNKLNISDSSNSALEMNIIDLDNSTNPSTTNPQYSGDIASSAPATVANTLEWLELINTNLKTNLSTRNKLMTLSYMMNREAGKGAMRDNFIKGVLNFIDTLKVPLRVKFQSFRTNSNDISSPISVYKHNAKNETSANGKPDWSWIKREIKANGTIALELGWYDSTGRKSGTWCNIAGYFEQNGTRKLLIKDDCKQDSAGGIRIALLSYDTSSSGYPVIVEHSTNNKQCFIESVVSIAYDPTVVFTGIGEDISGAVTNFNIYPNPASKEETMTLEFFAPVSGDIEISVYDLIGNKIQIINSGYYEKGQYKVLWNGNDNFSSTLQSGIFVVVLKGEKYRAATKLIKY